MSRLDEHERIELDILLKVEGLEHNHVLVIPSQSKAGARNRETALGLGSREWPEWAKQDTEYLDGTRYKEAGVLVQRQYVVYETAWQFSLHPRDIVIRSLTASGRDRLAELKQLEKE